MEKMHGIGFSFLVLAAVLCVSTPAGPLSVLLKEESEMTQVTFGPGAEVGPRCSPDGQWIAFEYFRSLESAPQIWIMPTDGDFSSARPMVDDGGYHAGISWSPDSQWISFNSTHPSLKQKGGLLTAQVHKVNIYTRKLVQLTNLPLDSVVEDSTSWSNRNEIAFEMNGDIYMVRASGGRAQRIVSTKQVNSNPVDLAWSPDAQEIAFALGDSSDETASLWIAQPRTHRVRRIFSNRMFAGLTWLDADTILFSETKDGKTKIYSMSLKTRSVTPITSGPLDLWGCIVPGTLDLFLNRSTTAQLRFDNSLVPALHIWRGQVRRLIMSRN